jgi:hypothetical protein
MLIRLVVIGLVMVLAAQESKAVDYSQLNHAWQNADARAVMAMHKAEEAKKIGRELASWTAGKQAFQKLDNSKKFSTQKLGAKNVLKIAKSQARKNKAEFENVFAMGFVSECYKVRASEVEKAASKLGIRKELTELGLVVNYLQL